MFGRHDALAMLGQGVVRSIRALKISWITTEIAAAWANVWRDLADDAQDLALPVRLLDAAVRYRETTDERVLLALPAEERHLLRPLVE